MPVHSNNPKWWFWIIAGILLLWAVAYAWLTFFSFVLADAGDWSAMVDKGYILPEYVDYIGRIPFWAVGLTAIAAVTRLAGAAGLVLRKRWSTWAYGLSLFCVIIIMFRGFVLADITSVIRTSQIWVEALFMGLSLFAYGFSLRMSKSRVLL